MSLESRTFRAICIVALGLTVQFGQAAAQSKSSNPAEGSTPAFRSKSQLVLVPVVVKDHKGAHISGLTKDDFVVKEDGAARRLAFCDEVKTTAERVKHSPTTDKTSFSNYQGEQAPRRIVILAMDGINTPFAAQATARKQLMKYLSDSVDPGALISLIMVKRNGIKVIHDFTSNPAVLVAALKKVRGGASDAETIEQLAPEDDPVYQEEVTDLTAFAQGESDSIAEQQRMLILSTLDAMQQIAHSFSGVPGRKSLIWVTGGFPFSINGSDALINGQSSSTTGIDDLLPEYEHMWALFNDANIAVYPVDVRGLENPTIMDASVGRTKPPTAYVTRQVMQHEDSLDTFRTFADMTGGKAFYNSNDLAKSFHEAADDSASYYMLGYYLDRDAKPGWHRLKVEMHHAGANARARDGFFVEKNDNSKVRQDEIAEALASPLDFTGVPLTLHWNARVRISNSTMTKVNFDVVLPANAVQVDDTDGNHVSFDVIAVAVLPDGTRSGNTAQNVDAHLKPETATKMHGKGLTYNQSLSLPGGSYKVRVVVRDNLSGRIGSVSAPLDIE